jgi:hypothetical protein
MGTDDDFHGAAFYVTRRMRAEWVDEDSKVLVARLKFLNTAPRLVLTWGSCRKPRKSPHPGKLGSP